MTDLKLGQAIRGMQSMLASKTVEIQLHWSEYLQGKWSTRESGGFSGSPVISRTVSANFKPGSVFIHVSKDYDAGEERGVYITLGGAIKGPIAGSFYLAGRNSLPEQRGYRSKPANPYSANDVQPTRYKGDDSLTVTFKQRITTEGSHSQVINQTLPILQQGKSFNVVPCNNDITLGSPDAGSLDTDNAEAVAKAVAAGLPEIASLVKPLFYQNNTDTFFVEPDVTERTVEEWNGWITLPPHADPSWRLGFKDVLAIPQMPWTPPLPGPEAPWRVRVDSGSLIQPRRGDDWLVNPLTGLRFDDEVIGPAGRAGIAIVPSHQIAGAVENNAMLANIHVASEFPAGTVAVVPTTTLAESGVTKIAGGLNVVGAAGFNSELARNFVEMNRSVTGPGRSAPGGTHS